MKEKDLSSSGEVPRGESRIRRLFGPVVRLFSYNYENTVYYPDGYGPGHASSTTAPYAGDHGPALGEMAEAEIAEMKREGTYIAPGYRRKG